MSDIGITHELPTPARSLLAEFVYGNMEAKSYS